MVLEKELGQLEIWILQQWNLFLQFCHFFSFFSIEKNLPIVTDKWPLCQKKSQKAIWPNGEKGWKRLWWLSKKLFHSRSEGLWRVSEQTLAIKKRLKNTTLLALLLAYPLSFSWPFSHSFPCWLAPNNWSWAANFPLLIVQHREDLNTMRADPTRGIADRGLYPIGRLASAFYP